MVPVRTHPQGMNGESSSAFQIKAVASVVQYMILLLSKLVVKHLRKQDALKGTTAQTFFAQGALKDTTMSRINATNVTHMHRSSFS